MSRQRPIGALSAVILSSLMSFACSGPATCALEGCKQDNGVVLANDYQAGTSADAEAQKDDLAQKIKEIYNRLGASEALAALLQETVKLHDTRIRMLEDHAKVVDSRLADIDGMIDHHEEEIHAQAKALRALEVSLTIRLETLAKEEKLARDTIQADLDTTEGNLRESIAELDADTKKSITDILDAMAVERTRVDNADTKVASDANKALGDLQILLQGKINLLIAEDLDIRSDIASEISRLDGRITDLNSKSTREFSRLWTSLGFLQAQILLVAADNFLEQKRIRDEIKTVKDALNKEIGSLKDADKLLLKKIDDLGIEHAATLTRLTTLETNYNAFVAEQKITNKSINDNYLTLTDTVNSLKKVMDDHITTEAARVKDIVNDLLVPVTNRVSALEKKSTDLQTDLDLLEGKVESDEVEFKKLQDLHKGLRKDYDQFVKDTSEELDTVNAMLKNIETCSISNRLVSVDLTCGSKTVRLAKSIF